MLISFRFSNYKSYKDETIFTTVCGDLKDLEENFSQIQNYKLLKSSIFIGANGSGKSNLIQAVQKFQAILQNSINIEKQKSYPHEPFFLDEKTKEKATFFEIEFFDLLASIIERSFKEITALILAIASQSKSSNFDISEKSKIAPE